MRVLGVDPGLVITGYGLVEETPGGVLRVLEAGCIKNPKTMSIADRLYKIFHGLDGLIKEYSPDVLALEEVYSHYGRPLSAIMTGHARGVICLLSSMYHIRLVHYTPTKIKKAVTGNGMASKSQVQRMVQGLFGLKAAPEPVDVTDALAVAVSHFYIDKKRRFL